MSDDLAAKLRQVLVDGLQPATVEVVDYDDGWPERFATLSSALRERLGARALRIEHIGSTSVPGLAAKDIIDICLTVADPDDEPAYLDDLLGLGWTLVVREPRHRVVRYAGPRSNLHVLADDAAEVTDYLLLREWLRSHPDDRDRYAAYKRELASRGEWPDINYYAEAKSPIIREMLAAAKRVGV
ncbi:MAG: GrpB family protein [Actinomycetes bacterium]